VLTWSRSTGSVPYQPTTWLSVDRRSKTIAVLLLLAGDVVFNPGPQVPQRSADQLTASLQVGSFNCRSVVNKAAQIHDLIAGRKLDILFLHRDVVDFHRRRRRASTLRRLTRSTASRRRRSRTRRWCRRRLPSVGGRSSTSAD